MQERVAHKKTPLWSGVSDFNLIYCAAIHFLHSRTDVRTCPSGPVCLLSGPGFFGVNTSCCRDATPIFEECFLPSAKIVLLYS